MSTEKNVRNSNFELLRILCMLMIVAYHYCLHGNSHKIFTSGLSVNQGFAIAFGSWGLLGVDCFVFISAFFLLNANKFGFKKLLKIIFQTIFYSLFIAIALSMSGLVHISLKQILRAFVSPFLSDYWYITAYCMLYLIHPFLNKIIKALKSETLFKLLVLLTIVIPISSTLFRDSYSTTGDFLFLIYLYLLMGYLKYKPNNFFEKNAKIGFLVTTLFTILFCICMSFIGTETGFNIIQKYTKMLILRYSPIMVIDALFLFYTFKSIQIKNSKIINLIANTTLGVYLFHENKLLHKVLWTKILHVNKVYFTSSFVLYLILSTVALFAIGMLIDIIRIYVIEKPLFSIKIADKHLDRISNWVNDNGENG